MLDERPALPAGRKAATPTAGEPPAVVVEGLGKSYGSVTAVASLSFAIHRRQTVALLGPNGAGKTTTMAMLLGLLQPSAGTIRILGQPMPQGRYRVLPRMNFTSPYVDLPQRLTVLQNLRVYGELYTIARPRERIAELAAALDLESFLDRPFGRLSAGQKTRVLLAKALINQPELLLLDEARPRPAAAAAATAAREPAEAAISVEGLGKAYGAVVAVADLSFAVGRRQTVALLGPNGAGKTTTMAMILGLLEPSAGTIRILGEPMPKGRSRVLPRMNFTSPYVDLPQRLTVRQNLRVYAELYALARPRERILELARALDLEPLLDRPFGRLSAGQKTRVLLAKALINEPELLLLDEPTASLDPDTADVLRGYLEEYQAHTHATVLLASHNMGEVERLAHHVLMLKAGGLIDQGSPAELLARYGRDDLEDVFLDIARDRRRPREGASP